jgi:hypothetical protein
MPVLVSSTTKPPHGRALTRFCSSNLSSVMKPEHSFAGARCPYSPMTVGRASRRPGLRLVSGSLAAPDDGGRVG